MVSQGGPKAMAAAPAVAAVEQILQTCSDGESFTLLGFHDHSYDGCYSAITVNDDTWYSLDGEFEDGLFFYPYETANGVSAKHPCCFCCYWGWWWGLLLLIVLMLLLLRAATPQIPWTMSRRAVWVASIKAACSAPSNLEPGLTQTPYVLVVVVAVVTLPYIISII